MILMIASLIIIVTSQCTLGLTNHGQGARSPQQEVQVSLPKDFQVKKENIFFFPNMNRIIVDVRPYDPLADPLNPINGGGAIGGPIRIPPLRANVRRFMNSPDMISLRRRYLINSRSGRRIGQRDIIV